MDHEWRCSSYSKWICFIVKINIQSEFSRPKVQVPGFFVHQCKFTFQQTEIKAGTWTMNEDLFPTSNYYFPPNHLKFLWVYVQNAICFNVDIQLRVPKKKSKIGQRMSRPNRLTTSLAVWHLKGSATQTYKMASEHLGCVWMIKITQIVYLGGGFKDFLFSPLFGEDSHFD